MMDTTILIVVAFLVTLYVCGKNLLRKRYYRDFIWFACMLAWTFVIMLAYTQKWPIAERLTSVAFFDQCMKPVTQQLRPIMNIELE
ncbi:hypothetical protein PCCS19_13650 [Paenibacillus sp. CCS19]|uniref:hypothetical protein n=1 Tax=Paenibacillus sp. CCS19 TaxID=3158387 RepID=UPI00256BC0FC|nr:hypothetical protein [Paenibacillus cellulosilyticus]GMK38311.1 hypothetical protein PCCS19_13650 [Paenibacillus cellulosilyticus]